MKKLILLIILLIIPTAVKGYYCDYQDVAKYKKIASNINYSYEYEEFEDNVKFYVTLVNLNEALYLKDSNGNIYNYTSSELVVEAKSGENLKFYVYPTDRYCDDEYLYTIRIQLPTYNIYYNDPLCKGIQDYPLCNKWATHNLNKEKFEQKVTEYRKSLETQDKPLENDEITPGLLDYIVEFLIEYYHLVLITIIIICSITIYIKSKKNNIYN